MAKLSFDTLARAVVIPRRVEMVTENVITLQLDSCEAEAIHHFLLMYYRESGKSINPSDHREPTSLNAGGARVLAALSAQISKVRARH